MHIRRLKLEGSFLLEPEKLTDDRGFFTRTWCKKELAAENLDTDIVQANISRNKSAGTLRGMHFQNPPYVEAKYVRCTAGQLYDVIVDNRRDSSTYREWFAIELNASRHETLYIPGGFAHGFQTLVDDTEILYLHTEYYQPNAADGLRWDDPRLGINWPMPESAIISERDNQWPLIQE